VISIILQYLLTASDPSWSCELTHRDPGVAGTYYLYCAQTTPDGIELVQVGRFVSDARAKTKHP
jgi:hypothetical protein